jgi:hypothetical protein
LAVAALSLQGCQQVKRGLGLEKVIPDEFAVVSRAPLAIPPDYALRPPHPGAPRAQETPIVDQARQNVFRAGDDQAKLPAPTGERTPGEGELLRQAGVANALPDIRDLVNREAAQNRPLDEGFVDKLLFWRHPEKAAAANQVVDPRKEAERLFQAKSAGLSPAPDAAPAASPPTQNAAATQAKPSAEGTPTIERTHTPSFLERWF